MADNETPKTETTPAVPAVDKAPEVTLSAEELRQRYEALKREAIERRQETKAEREKREAAERALSELRAEKAKRETEELAAQGKFKELAEAAEKERARLASENAELAKKAALYEANLKAEETALRQEIGDAGKDLTLDSLSLESRVATLRTVAGIKRKVAAETAPVVNTPNARTAPVVSTGNVGYDAKVSEILADKTLSHTAKALALRNLKK